MLGLLVSIHLDSPLGRKEAKTRGIVATFSRLLIEGERNVLAELIHGCCPRNKAVFIHAIGQFTSLDKLASVFKELNIEVFTDHGFVSAKDKEQINLVFSRWNAEILTVFFADQTTASLIIGSLPRLHTKWWRFSQEGYEAPYLKQVQLADPFFFFSPTRSSLEVIGSENQILECFNRVRGKVC
jgi:hypothetical protein